MPYVPTIQGSRRPRRPPQQYKWSDLKYKTVVRQLRRFATGFSPDDGYDLRNMKALTTARKRRIRKYGAYLIRESGGRKVIYRPRKSRNLRVAQDVTGMGPGYGSFKVAFVPVAEPDTEVQIQVKTKRDKKTRKLKSRMGVYQPKATVKYYRFDREKFAKDPEGQTRKAYRSLKARGMEEFGIPAGRMVLDETTVEDFLWETVQNFIVDYGKDNVIQWLFAIQGVKIIPPKRPITKKDIRGGLKTFKEWR